MISARFAHAEGILTATVDRSWHPEIATVVDCLAEHFRGSVAGSGLGPPARVAELRSMVHARAPQLSEMADELRVLLDAGVCAVIVHDLGLDAAGVDARRKVLYVLSALMGYPTGTDPHRSQVVWDVRPRRVSDEYYATFSEHDQEAEYHTDTQYYPHPERFFLLYVVREAGCGGGVSTLLNGRWVKEKMLEQPTGRIAYDALTREPVPFRIPSLFASAPNAVEHTVATVFRGDGIPDAPFLRWRLDTIERGLSDLPEYDTERLRSALKTFQETLDLTQATRLQMPTDSLCVVDNHVALHGRTAFRDPDRHLLRIRFHHQVPDAA